MEYYAEYLSTRFDEQNFVGVLAIDDETGQAYGAAPPGVVPEIIAMPLDPTYLADYCQQITEQRARALQPQLFVYLEALEKGHADDENLESR